MLLRGLADRGHEVLLLCNSRMVAERAASEGVPTRLCVIGGDIALHHSFQLASALRSFRADAFIVGTYKKLFLAALGARMASVPRIVARVGLESDTPRNWKYRFALRRWTDAVAVNAQRIVGRFAELDGFGPDRVTLIHNGVPPLRAPGQSSLRKELGIENDAFVVGTVARLAKQKRIDRLLEVAALLPASVHVVIAGDGTRREELERLSERKGVSSRVHFIGHRDDKTAVYDSLDVFVLTSDSEGLSNAMLEAMTRELPVVSTPVSGADDALRENGNGVPAGVVTEFNASSIAEAISNLIDSPATRKAIGAAARERALEEFSLDAMLDKWEAFLAPAAVGRPA